MPVVTDGDSNSSMAAAANSASPGPLLRAALEQLLGVEGGGVAEAMARGIRITLQAGGQVWNKCGVEGGGVAEAMARGIRIRLQARRAGMEHVWVGQAWMADYSIISQYPTPHLAHRYTSRSSTSQWMALKDLRCRPR